LKVSEIGAGIRELSYRVFQSDVDIVRPLSENKSIRPLGHFLATAQVFALFWIFECSAATAVFHFDAPLIVSAEEGDNGAKCDEPGRQQEGSRHDKNWRASSHIP
jgi:hypothetical protein